MKFIVTYYRELTHTEPCGWQEVSEWQVTAACDGFLVAQPDGFCKVMRRDTFLRTTYGKSVYGKAVEQVPTSNS